MKRMSMIAGAVMSLSASFCGAQEPAKGQVGPGVPAFNVRPGYKVTAASGQLADARFIELDDQGTLYVAQPRSGDIVSLKDKDGDGVYETQAKFITGKKQAHGMHFVGGWLWFTQSTGIHKARDTNSDGVADEVVTIAAEGSLPGGKGHWWRSILVTDDGFYTSVGDSGNATDELEGERQKIWKYDLEGKNKKLFASGVRNTEKLRFRPGTTELWGVDHNSDNFGQNLGEQPGKNQPITDTYPPEELNHYVEGGFYGHPILVGHRVPRIEYQQRPDLLALAAKTTVPAFEFGPHWAGNGWCFVTRDTFSGLKGDMLVAFHGSWNSSKKVGYRIERVMFDQWTGKPCGSQMIVGTLGGADGQQVLARPVDVTEAPDGSILWSCDHTKKVYRITK